MAAVAAAGHGHAATASTAPPAGLKSTSQLEDVERKYHTLVRKAKAVFTAIPAAEELEATWTGLKLGDLPEPVEACLRAKSCSTEPTLELSIANEGQDQGKLLMIPLKVLKKGLDAGRSVTAPPGRGLPLWLAVRRAFCASNADRSAAEHRHVLQIRALKASWHQEGTWPLRGNDEGLAADSSETSPEKSLAAIDADADASEASADDGSDSESNAERAPIGPTLVVPLEKLQRSRWPAKLLLRPPTQSATNDGSGASHALPMRQPEPGLPARPDPSPRQIARMYARRANSNAKEDPS